MVGQKAFLLTCAVLTVSPAVPFFPLLAPSSLFLNSPHLAKSSTSMLPGKAAGQWTAQLSTSLQVLSWAGRAVPGPSVPMTQLTK